MTINFVDFKLHVPITGECNDFVMLYDGDSESDTQIGDQFCYRYSPGCQESSSNDLLVTFTSDYGIANRGLSAKFYFGGQYE